MDIPSPALARTLDLSAVQRWLRGRRGDLLAELGDYVSRETPSDSKPHLDAGLDWLTVRLTEVLGSPEAVRRVPSATHGDTLVADFAGVGPRRLLVLCHYDTVWDAGTLAERPFVVEGRLARGPGVFDMKAGLVQALWAVRALDAAGLPRPPLRFVLNGDEELGSPASRSVIEAAADGVTAALVLEPGLGGALKTARKGIGMFRIDVTGVEAHAGLDPEKGISAIDELARIVLTLRAVQDLGRGTSVNVGTISGGTRGNVIAGHAWAAVDVRVAAPAEAQRVDAALSALRPADPRLTVTVGGGWNRPPMTRTPGIAAMVDLARALAVGLGEDLSECAVGGGSDANFLAARGVPLLDGLGAVGAGAHARDEHIDVDATLARAALIAAIVHAFAR
ncbi:peptidase M20 [Asanoa ishikariensis]|uniref:Glutamate carboxypeptidase n=1 Tax=Asanoa ishikariensis TaxID=137265 RepID=A0A1H3UJI7_9ACTN|nr:M20 family metallopeptidase [Asanoa ishikariensis]GIF63508.1 peptidase M20 [Asanoa ishikariensis]SDZ61879.1 glutamate carboxypeptidase [Asanoa ishikariensis]